LATMVALSNSGATNEEMTFEFKKSKSSLAKAPTLASGQELLEGGIGRLSHLLI
jgi:hypothetical protein